MADKTLESVVGNTGLLQMTQGALGGTIPAGTASGVILSITPPAGQRVVLIGLVPRTESTINGISVSIGGNTVISSKALSYRLYGSTNAYFAIGAPNFDITPSNHYYSTGYIDKIICGVDETLEVSSSTTTTQTIVYAYYFAK